VDVDERCCRFGIGSLPTWAAGSRHDRSSGWRGSSPPTVASAKTFMALNDLDLATRSKYWKTIAGGGTEGGAADYVHRNMGGNVHAAHVDNHKHRSTT
jgi:hypothetical protein